MIVFNNGGVYGGDRRSFEEILGFYKEDLVLMLFVLNVGYYKFIEVFGGKGYIVEMFDEFKFVFFELFVVRKLVVVNVIIDFFVGVESGRL